MKFIFYSGLVMTGDGDRWWRLVAGYGATLARHGTVQAIARCQCFVSFNYFKRRDYCPCSFQLPTAQGLVSNRFIVHASAAARRASKNYSGISTGAIDPRLSG
jgi:hypothetical protein